MEDTWFINTTSEKNLLDTVYANITKESFHRDELVRTSLIFLITKIEEMSAPCILTWGKGVTKMTQSQSSCVNGFVKPQNFQILAYIDELCL